MQKRKSSFNIIDALIILLVLAVCAGAYFIFFGKKEQTPTPIVEDTPAPKVTANVSYVVQVSDLPAEFADNITVGEKVIDYATHASAGKVTAVESKPSVYVGYNKETGEQVLTPLDDYVDLFVTIEGEATFISDLYHINSTSMYIGKKLDMMMPDLFCSGYCISFETVE